MALSTGFRIRQPERQEFDPLPEDTYEVEIEEIEDRERDVYEKPGEKEIVVGFTFRIVEKGEFAKRKLWKDAPPVFWPGSQGGSPSTLYSIFSAVTGRKPNEAECKSLNAEDINGLEGKRLRVVVSQKQSRKGEIRNIITGFLPAKGTPAEEDDDFDFGDENADDVEPENPLA
jgi:hypothetical protein